MTGFRIWTDSNSKCPRFLLLILFCCYFSRAIVLLNSTDRSFTPIGCSELSPFGTLSYCFVRCTSINCSNAREICSTTLSPYCGAIVRYDKAVKYEGSLDGQLVQLVSLDTSFNTKAHSRRMCYQLGRAVSKTNIAEKVMQHDSIRQKARELYEKKEGAVLFLHMSKNGGTTMCAIARANNLITPVNEDHMHLFLSVMGNSLQLYTSFNRYLIYYFLLL